MEIADMVSGQNEKLIHCHINKK